MDKACSKCGETKPTDAFWKDSRYRGGYQHQCKACKYKVSEEWRKRNRESVNAKQREYQRANPDVARRSWVKKKYGMTWDEYQSMVFTHDNRCGVCWRTADEAEPGRLLSVDHCHETGRVRGLLCGGCNRALGLLQDDVLRIRKLAEYVERYAR